MIPETNIPADPSEMLCPGPGGREFLEDQQFLVYRALLNPKRREWIEQFGEIRNSRLPDLIDYRYITWTNRRSLAMRFGKAEAKRITDFRMDGTPVAEFAFGPARVAREWLMEVADREKFPDPSRSRQARTSGKSPAATP